MSIVLQYCECSKNKDKYYKGSVYFTGDILAATDRLELMCHHSKIWSRGMMQY